MAGILALSASLLSVASTSAGAPASAVVQAPSITFPQASPPALVREQIGLTTVEIEYSRPGAKGRQVFGGLVPFGEVWRTGANAATKITFSKDVRFGGQAVPAGTYGFFSIPGAEEWTLILNKVTEQWGSYSYDAANDLVRVRAKRETLAAPVETLTLGIQGFEGASATLSLTWETTRVSVPIETNLVAELVPQIEAAMAAEGGTKPYFSAAMFYYANDVDLMQALEWIDKAVEAQPDAVWILYRKGLILADLGEQEAAMEVARQTVEMAGKQPGEIGAEYVRLGKALLARTQG